MIEHDPINAPCACYEDLRMCPQSLDSASAKKQVSLGFIHITGHLRNRLIGGTDHKAYFVNGVNFKEVYPAKTFRIPEDLILHFRILVLFE